jgi:hypothetical protein
MMLDELESKQRYQEYLREVRQEQLYQQVKVYRSNQHHPNDFGILFTPILLNMLAFIKWITK